MWSASRVCGVEVDVDVGGSGKGCGCRYEDGCLRVGSCRLYGVRVGGHKSIIVDVGRGGGISLGGYRVWGRISINIGVGVWLWTWGEVGGMGVGVGGDRVCCNQGLMIKLPLGKGYLFEEHLTMDQEPPQPQWLVQSNLMTTLAATMSQAETSENNTSDGPTNLPRELMDRLQELIPNR
uniref:Uncharacterized protein n=1 Tax=Lactuca sativa TaxID=4236 RepID=A0A9R1UFF0_LACSA|nr:hypothetical protein LSAT_V11C900475530 [Lactuca sativa]